MGNRRIMDKQKGLYMENKKRGDTQVIAAAKSGVSIRSAKRIEKGKLGEVQLKTSNPRDPFVDVWDKELKPLLEKDPYLRANTLLEDLQERYPEKYADSHLRTLQRRVRNWKALHGPQKERMFLQEHPPGWQGISDFTDCSGLNVTIAETPLDHLLYHFRLPFSSWSYAFVILGGESYPALSTGFQNALWELGGVPHTHRTDSLSAAFKNINKTTQEDFTKAYEELCCYYAVEATRNNKGVKHENGSIECPHRHLKEKIDQQLRIRNSRDFSSIEEYRKFVDDIVKKRNMRSQEKLAIERKYLRELPKHKTRDYDFESVGVPSTGVITVRQTYYAVPSRLIGNVLNIHLYDDRLECFLGNTHVITLKRLRWSKSGPRPRNIDYRLIIPELVRKPQAFRNYIFRDDLFPREEFRQAWTLLDSRLDDRTACKEMVQILNLAAGGLEEQISLELRRHIREQSIPSAAQFRERFKTNKRIIPFIEVEQRELNSYDQLLNIATQ
jgi:hypothetical protein